MHKISINHATKSFRFCTLRSLDSANLKAFIRGRRTETINARPVLRRVNSKSMPAGSWDPLCLCVPAVILKQLDSIQNRMHDGSYMRYLVRSPSILVKTFIAQILVKNTSFLPLSNFLRRSLIALRCVVYTDMELTETRRAARDSFLSPLVSFIVLLTVSKQNLQHLPYLHYNLVAMSRDTCR